MKKLALLLAGILLICAIGTAKTFAQIDDLSATDDPLAPSYIDAQDTPAPAPGVQALQAEDQDAINDIDSDSPMPPADIDLEDE